MTAISDDGEIMALEHTTMPVYGVQFHPESILTPDGRKILENFWHPSNKLHTSKGVFTMIKAIIRLSKEDLSYTEAEEVMNEIMEGKASPIQISSYLTALSLKARRSARSPLPRQACGHTALNCCTIWMCWRSSEPAVTGLIPLISPPLPPCDCRSRCPGRKHGNRAASSKSGAADVLEALGVKIDLPPERSAKLLKTINICFLFAQNYHIAMKYVAPIRKELGIRTVFNILGPLPTGGCQHGTDGRL